ncbi:hypothetical protein B296_00000839 [Ensete ventricosum]|uniref:Uncharacterized protein n=1 Tax=Ensete ventricosum TaxID=4639 RepID=A0A426ZSF7_ENSVE|nr:hypothetical protein B296_00000839 [Ensete ventricosum]
MSYWELEQCNGKKGLIEGLLGVHRELVEGDRELIKNAPGVRQKMTVTHREFTEDWRSFVAEIYRVDTDRERSILLRGSCPRQAYGIGCRRCAVVRGQAAEAAARWGDACWHDACRLVAYGQKHRPQGLLPTASKGNTRPQPVRNGAAPVELPPAGAEPTARATATAAAA